VEIFRHDQTFERDLEACAGWLRDRGVGEFVLVGECFGARTALACGDLPGLAAVILLAAPVRDAAKVPGGDTVPLVRHRSLPGYARRAFRADVVRGLADRRTRRRYLRAALGALRAEPAPRIGSGTGWVSDTFLEQLDFIRQRGIPILLVNGTDDPGLEDFERAKGGRLGSLLDGPLVRQVLLQGRIAAWADTAAQASTIDVVSRWLKETLPAVSKG
jgi:hypothetical protein